MSDILENHSPEDFLSVLPPDSRREALRESDNPEALFNLARYLSQEPSSGLSTKGGSFWPDDIAEQVATEVHIFFCTDDPKYESWRSKLENEGDIAAKAAVLLVSNAVASTAGFVAALCVPFVAITMAVGAKVTKEAWCEKMSEEFMQTETRES
jgi:hypothetical protein